MWPWLAKLRTPEPLENTAFCPPPFPFFAQYCMYVFIQGRAREVIVRLDRKNGALQHERSKLYSASHQRALAVLARAQKCCRWKICCHSSEASSEEWLRFSTSLASSECFPHALGFALEGSRGKTLFEKRNIERGLTCCRLLTPSKMVTSYRIELRFLVVWQVRTCIQLRFKYLLNSWKVLTLCCAPLFRWKYLYSSSYKMLL